MTMGAANARKMTDLAKEKVNESTPSVIWMITLHTENTRLVTTATIMRRPFTTVV